MKDLKLLSLLVFSIFILNSCDPNMVYDQFMKTGDNSWSWGEKQIFEVKMEDPDQFYNIFINIRHTKEYPKSNLYVFLSIQGPNDAVTHDTIDIGIADPRGKWLGDGFGDVKFVRKKIREKVRFAFPGDYTFTLSQGMRLEEVPVTDVGLRIEKFKSIN
ncbi:MAG: gliding motility lipoprotein GldH [Bacteroidales bacterium]|nr:gliding motility lipoprotein GldH [Bacteroidales bacterium]